MDPHIQCFVCFLSHLQSCFQKDPTYTNFELLIGPPIIYIGLYCHLFSLMSKILDTVNVFKVGELTNLYFLIATENVILILKGLYYVHIGWPL